MTQDQMLAEALAQLMEMRAALDRQQEINAQQQAAISALQRQVMVVGVALDSGAETQSDDCGGNQCEARDDSLDAARVHVTPPMGERGKMGRRGLLLGAAGVAGATVAAAATVAINSPQPVEAATGANFVLGQQNDAGAVTSLVNTANTTTDLLSVTATQSSDIHAIVGSSFVGAGTGITPNKSISLTPRPGSGTGGVLMMTVGVSGLSDYGIGAMGQSQNFLDLAAFGTGRIWQTPQSQVGAPLSSGGPYLMGESIRDANGDLWLCTGYDTNYNPVWAKVALLAPGATSGGAITYLTKPIRLLDTRAGATDALFHPGAPYTSANPYPLQVAGDVYNGVTVPTSLTGPVGAIGNVTVVNPAGGGYIALVPHGVGFTGTAILAYSAGQTVSNSFNVGLGPGGVLDIIIGGASTDVIIDLFAVV